MSDIEQLFDKNGNFKIKSFDPYRINRTPYASEKEIAASEYYDILFDENGSCLFSVYELQAFIAKNKFSNFSDIVKLFYAQKHGQNTKGSAPAIYMWN